MVSLTQKTESIRLRKARKRAKMNATAQKRRPTPAFAIHPQGYDTSAADAKSTTSTDNTNR